MSIISLIRTACKDTKGIASLEYALLAVGILTGLAAAITAVRTPLDTLYSTTIVSLL